MLSIAVMLYTDRNRLVMRLTLGGLWLIVFGAALDVTSGSGRALLWTLPAGLTWALLLAHETGHPSRKANGFGWWLMSLTGPLSLLLLLLRGDPVERPQPSFEPREEVEMSTDDLLL